jgi:hypothetical protein
MMRPKTFPTLLVLMGSMDCLTTVIGILYFGAVELNPLLVGVVSTNLPLFAALKLSTTFFICLIFFQAEKILMKSQDKTAKSFTATHKFLKIAYIGVIIFLFVTVANNVFVLLNAL